MVGGMHHYFIFYADSRQGFLYADESIWFDVEDVLVRAPSATFYGADTHDIHRYGSLMKHYGLRNSLILRVDNEQDAVMIRLTADSLFKEEVTGKHNKPVLQAILRNPDFKYLDSLCGNLIEYKKNETRRRSEAQAALHVQTGIEKLAFTVDAVSDLISKEYLKALSDFQIVSQKEIDRIRDQSKEENIRAKIERKTLMRELLRDSVYVRTKMLK